jgi:hypothetical protein
MPITKIDGTGQLYGPSINQQLTPGVTGAIAETMPRSGPLTNQVTLTLGQLKMTAIYLPVQTTVTSIGWMSGTQAAVAPTNWWFGLYNSALLGLALTADQTNTAWGASTVKSVNLTAPFVTTYSGLHYLGCMLAGGTAPSGYGVTATATGPVSLAPILNGNSTASLTTPPTPGTAGGVGGTAGALTVSAAYGYGWIS